MEIEKGQIVRSRLGRDAQRFYIVAALSEGFAYIVDGKLHKVEKPKKKNLKHLSKTNQVVPITPQTTNKQVRQILFSYNYEE